MEAVAAEYEVIDNNEVNHSIDSSNAVNGSQSMPDVVSDVQSPCTLNDNATDNSPTDTVPQAVNVS